MRTAVANTVHFVRVTILKSLWLVIINKSEYSKLAKFYHWYEVQLSLKEESEQL